MTTAAAAMAPRDHLTDFEGRDVLRTTVAVTHAGDGLSEALSIAPGELAIGDTVTILLEATVVDVRFKPVDKDDPDMGLVRQHTLRAGTATIVTGDFAGTLLADQRDRLLRAKEDAAGVQRLGDAAEPADEDVLDDAFAGEVKSLSQRRNRTRRNPPPPVEQAEAESDE